MKKQRSPDLNTILSGSYKETIDFHVSAAIHVPVPQNRKKKIPPEWQKVYFKSYARLPEFRLPKKNLPKRSLEDVLSKRKSQRLFSTGSIPIATLSALLRYSSGLKRRDGNDLAVRYYPSAGSRYPLEVYALLNGTSLPSGLYHYYVKNHSLEQLIATDARTKIDLRGLIIEKQFHSCPVYIIITGVFKRTFVKYGERRGYRYVLLEAGHLAQNFLLNAQAFSIAACPIGGFLDDKINALLDVDGYTESVIYVIAIGKHAKK